MSHTGHYKCRCSQPSDMDLPGYRLDPLRGKFAGFWSVTVSANWRIVFRFDGSDVRDVDLVDYHQEVVIRDNEICRSRQ